MAAVVAVCFSRPLVQKIFVSEDKTYSRTCGFWLTKYILLPEKTSKGGKALVDPLFVGFAKRVLKAIMHNASVSELVFFKDDLVKVGTGKASVCVWLPRPHLKKAKKTTEI